MAWTTEDKKKLRLAMEKAFEPWQFDMFAREELEITVSSLSAETLAYPKRLFDVIQASDDRTLTLWIRKVSGIRAKNAHFSALLAKHGGPDPIDDHFAAVNQELEALIRERDLFFDVGELTASLHAIQKRVCRIEARNKLGDGTGFLVGRNIVLTTYHVMEPVLKGSIEPETVVFRFDFYASPDSDPVVKGHEFGLVAEGWLVDHSVYDQIDLSNIEASDGGFDYCLVRIQPKDTAPVSTAAATVESGRGWLSIRKPSPRPVSGDLVFVFQHPEGRPLKMAIGRIKNAEANSSMIFYDAPTLPGSSGGPVLNYKLDLIAMHRAMRKGHNGHDADYIGIAVRDIATSAERNGILLR